MSRRKEEEGDPDKAVLDALQRGMFIRHMYLDVVERILVYWSCMQYSRLMLCSNMADLSR
jgi:hypothetical protein